MAAFQAADGVSTTPTRSFLSRENSRQIPESSNGKTTASKPVDGGSIPLSGVVCSANGSVSTLASESKNAIVKLWKTKHKP